MISEAAGCQWRAHVDKDTDTQALHAKDIATLHQVCQTSPSLLHCAACHLFTSVHIVQNLTAQQFRSMRRDPDARKTCEAAGERILRDVELCTIRAVDDF